MEDNERKKLLEGLPPDIRMLVEMPAKKAPPDTQLLSGMVSYLKSKGIDLKISLASILDAEVTDKEIDLGIGWVRLAETFLRSNEGAGAEFKDALREIYAYAKFPPVDVVGDEDRMPGDLLISKGRYEPAKYDTLLGQRSYKTWEFEDESGDSLLCGPSDAGKANADLLSMFILLGETQPQVLARAVLDTFPTVAKGGL